MQRKILWNYQFVDDEVNFLDDNLSCHGAKEIKAFLKESHIKLMTCQVNSLDLNLIENL